VRALPLPPVILSVSEGSPDFKRRGFFGALLLRMTGKIRRGFFGASLLRMTGKIRRGFFGALLLRMTVGRLQWTMYN